MTWDKELVDASTARMINRPASLDTIVATNLHADILSDLAAALAGSLGIAPTGNIDPERRYPSMFEPIHGSAFDIMGKGLANPVGTFWSVVMLLEHLGEAEAAKRADAGHRAGHRQPRAAHPRPGRQGHHGRGHASRVRPAGRQRAAQGRLTAPTRRAQAGADSLQVPSARAMRGSTTHAEAIVEPIDRRALLRAMFDAAIAAAQPALCVPRHLPAAPKGRLIVIGAGKASAAMAQAVEDHWPGAAVRAGRHALRLRRALRAHRDRRGRASGARRGRLSRRPSACCSSCTD